MNNLLNLSPLDGRYATTATPLKTIFSEYGLMQKRLHIEIEWFIALAQHPTIVELPPLSENTIQQLRQLSTQFDLNAAQQIKTIEQETNHDVKAVEIYLRRQTADLPEVNPHAEFWHFACTSEDINNLSYGLLLKEGIQQLLKEAQQLQHQLNKLADTHQAVAMLSRTHGQSATPTTLGKEIANFSFRLNRQLSQLTQQPILGKINGAVGNYNAHVITYPELNWQTFCQSFVESLGLQFNPMTTQIESHDFAAEIAHNLHRYNTILTDLARDFWGYISLAYFKQKTKAGEVGSSTMPHKVNPIDFENAEGNCSMANAVLNMLADRLPISRWQRDLTDSTLQRNWGNAFGHSLIALTSLQRGLTKLEVNHQIIANDLNQHPEILAEAIQTVMRRYAITDAYTQIKNITRGKTIHLQQFHDLINNLPIPNDTKQRLLNLTPQQYTGLAQTLTQSSIKEAKKHTTIV